MCNSCYAYYIALSVLKGRTSPAKAHDFLIEVVGQASADDIMELASRLLIKALSKDPVAATLPYNYCARCARLKPSTIV